MNKRHLMMAKLMLISGPMKRARYMKEKGVFHSMGDHCMITSRKVPLYGKLISIGNNVWVASGVQFVTHDACHFMLNGMEARKGSSKRFTEKVGCIEIGDNVFIGSNSQILYDVKIGDNVIIAAGSIVNKDIPSGSVVAGVPARVIGSFDDFVSKRENLHYEHPADNWAQYISEDCEREMWLLFRKKRDSIEK